MAGLVLDVSELVARPGASRGVRGEFRVPGLTTALGSVGDDEPVVVDVVADAVSEGIAVTGTVSATAHLSCSRCLIGYDQTVVQPVDETYYFGGEGEERDGYDVVNNHIDLEPMLRDVIMLALPTRPLHDENCRGLCAICGADLNRGDCGHDRTPVDLRWAPLEALRGALTEPERSN